MVSEIESVAENHCGFGTKVVLSVFQSSFDRYLVTDAWAEKEVSQNGQSFIRWKFRFEYLESQGPPWWISDPEINPEPIRKPFWNPRQRTEKVDENQEILPIDGSAASELSEKENSSSRFAERKRLRKERRKRKEEGGSPLSFKR